jgi:hypothetical protein
MGVDRNDDGGLWRCLQRVWLADAGIIGALIAALVVFRSRTVAPEFLFTVIWALAGIMVSNGVSGLIVSTLAAGGILVLLAAMTMWVSDDVQP